MQKHLENGMGQIKESLQGLLILADCLVQQSRSSLLCKMLLVG